MDAWEDMAYKHFTLNMMALLPVWFGIVRSQNPDTFWSDYPACEEKCHQSVWADQQCSLQNSCGCTSGQTSGCLCLADKCLCVTNSWLITVSQCIGQQCGSAAVTNAASIVQNACSGKGYNLAVPSSELVSAGLAAITTTVAPSTSSYISTSASTTPPSVSSSPASSSSTPNKADNQSGTSVPQTSNSDSGLSGGAIAGIVIGIVVVLAMLLGAGFWFYRRRHHRQSPANMSEQSPPSMQEKPVQAGAGHLGELPGAAANSGTNKFNSVGLSPTMATELDTRPVYAHELDPYPRQNLQSVEIEAPPPAEMGSDYAANQGPWH